MSRVALVGSGPLPSAGARFTSFAQLRLAGFRRALERAGFSVRVVLLGAKGDGPPTTTWAGLTHVLEEGPRWLDRVAERCERADVLVSAGPYNPGRAACLVAGDRPVWADLPGDPFAELAAALALRDLDASSSSDGERRAATYAAAAPVLARADALSVVSGPQRYAALGQLGLLGRLGVPVTVVPIAWDLPLPRSAPRPRAPDDPLVVALTGGFNTWLDVDAIIAGLERAWARGVDLRVICTGGAVTGHPQGGYATFARWAEHDDRVRLAGWVPHARLAHELAHAHAGLYLDRPGPEPELGARTRLVLFAWLGLDTVATITCEQARELAEHDLLVPLAPGDPAALAEALERLYRDDSARVDRARRAALWFEQNRAPLSTYRPIIDWVRAPRRAPAATPPEADLAEALARTRAELAAIHATPTWKLLARAHALLRGR